MSMRLSRSVVGEAEARAVSRVITEDGYLGMGNEVRLFEEEVAQYLGVKPSQVITVNTGTAALHLAVDAVAAHETAILQYMQDCNANFRILEEPLLVTGIGVAFALNDTRGLDEKLTETFAAMRADGTMKQIVGKYLPDPEKYLEVDALEP